MKQTQKDPTGTSFHDCTITATVNELKTILGTPEFSDNDGEDKVNFEWNMETDNGDIFTVYDWKEYRAISEDEKINWHIGGKSAAVTIQAKAEITAALNSPEPSPIGKEVENEGFTGADFCKGKDYNFNRIEKVANGDNYQLNELGGETIGKAFIVLEHNEKDITISFILTGYNSVTGNQYTCIYSDL